MVRVGIAGMGFMGWIHYLAYQKVPGAQFVALCTRDEKKLAGDWTSIQGNFGPRGEEVSLSGVATYRELDDLIRDPDIDLIDNCLPPYLHADFTIAAVENGKHVLCEKPMALSTDDCDRMVAAAKANGKQVLVAHVLPFFPEFAYARKVIESGKYGKVLGGYFKRVISDPIWLEDFYDEERVGGPLVDLHVHDAHFIRLIFGMPETVMSQGRMRGDVVEYCNTMFRFSDPDICVAATSGVINQQGREFTHAYEIHLEGATLHFDFAAFKDKAELMPLRVLVSNEEMASHQVQLPELGDGDPVRAFEIEMEEVVRSIESDEPSQVLSGELARDAILLCHKQTESVKSGQPVNV